MQIVSEYTFNNKTNNFVSIPLDWECQCLLTIKLFYKSDRYSGFIKEQFVIFYNNGNYSYQLLNSNILNNQSYSFIYNTFALKCSIEDNYFKINGLNNSGEEIISKCQVTREFTILDN